MAEKVIVHAGQILIEQPQLDASTLRTMEISKRQTETRIYFQSLVVMGEVHLIHQCFLYSVDSWV
jgi:hypothetical protein